MPTASATTTSQRTMSISSNSKRNVLKKVLKEEHEFFVQELKHAVEQRITHAVVAAADAGAYVEAGNQLLRLELIGLGDVLAGQPDPGQRDRLRFVLVVDVGDGLAGDFVAGQLALVHAGHVAGQADVDIEF